MSRRPFRLPAGELPFLEVASLGRSGPPETRRFSPTQIEQIRRTVRRTPEVMVKVTGGGKNAGAVAAHFAYIEPSISVVPRSAQTQPNVMAFALMLGCFIPSLGGHGRRS